MTCHADLRHLLPQIFNIIAYSPEEVKKKQIMRQTSDAERSVRLRARQKGGRSLIRPLFNVELEENQKFLHVSARNLIHPFQLYAKFIRNHGNEFGVGRLAFCRIDRISEESI